MVGKLIGKLFHNQLSQQSLHNKKAKALLSQQGHGFEEYWFFWGLLWGLLFVGVCLFFMCCLVDLSSYFLLAGNCICCLFQYFPKEKKMRIGIEIENLLLTSQLKLFLGKSKIERVTRQAWHCLGFRGLNYSQNLAQYVSIIWKFTTTLL